MVWRAKLSRPIAKSMGVYNFKRVINSEGEKYSKKNAEAYGISEFISVLTRTGTQQSEKQGCVSEAWV